MATDLRTAAYEQDTREELAFHLLSRHRSPYVATLEDMRELHDKLLLIPTQRFDDCEQFVPGTVIP